MPVPPPKRTYPATFFKHPTIQVLRKEDATTGKCPTGVYESIPTSTPDKCNHTTQMCWGCSDIWHVTYYVRSFKHGLSGRGQGCLCDVCREANRQNYWVRNRTKKCTCKCTCGAKKGK